MRDAIDAYHDWHDANETRLQMLDRAERNGWYQKELADRIGVATSTISRALRAYRNRPLFDRWRLNP